MPETNGHNAYEVNWTLRSLLAAGLLSVCVMASAMSANISVTKAEEEQRRQAALDKEAAMVADLARFLAAETASTREALEGPRLKPALPVATLAADEDPIGALAPFDFTELTIAKLDAEERNCLAEAIYYEARSEPRVGQLAVADVVLNRVASRIYPNSICEVVYQGSERRTGCQFSFTCDGSMQARLNQRKWRESQDLAGAVLAGVRVPISRNATHYHADYVWPYWADNLTPTATVGVHKFYKFPSRRTLAAAPAAM